MASTRVLSAASRCANRSPPCSRMLACSIAPLKKISVSAAKPPAIKTSMPPPQAAAAQDFILSKCEGYDTLVGERGGKLSGGERQRIAIARAVLKNAPILVLDEATSALDVETEARVKEAIDRLRDGRTTFIIAHRLTTVRDADRVIFMDNGHIVEQGAFHELAISNGRFAGLLRAGGLLNRRGSAPPEPDLGRPRRGCLERRASFWTHKGRSKFLNLRIVLTENRTRFSGPMR